MSQQLKELPVAEREVPRLLHCDTGIKPDDMHTAAGQQLTMHCRLPQRLINKFRNIVFGALQDMSYARYLWCRYTNASELRHEDVFHWPWVRRRLVRASAMTPAEIEQRELRHWHHLIVTCNRSSNSRAKAQSKHTHTHKRWNMSGQ